MEDMCKQLFERSEVSDEMIERVLSQARNGELGGGSELDAPILTGRHIPSTTQLSALQLTTLKEIQLQRDSRHVGKAISLAIRSISISNGTTLVVQDSAGERGSVWSLIEYPCPGGEDSLSQGTIIAIKEPYYGLSINGNLPICVHHPSDIVRVSKYDHIAAKQLSELAGKQGRIREALSPTN